MATKKVRKASPGRRKTSSSAKRTSATARAARSAGRSGGKSAARKAPKKRTAPSKARSTARRAAKKAKTRRAASQHKTAQRKAAQRKTARGGAAARQPATKSAPARRRAEPSARRSRTRRGSEATWHVVKVGFDLGNCRTVVAASRDGEVIEQPQDIFSNVVGFLKVAGRQGHGQESTVFSEDAFRHRRELDLRRPIRAGVVVDVKVCRQFAMHLCSGIDPAGAGRLWGVIGVPVDITREQWERTRRGMGGVLERIVLAPEPFLAAEGMNLDRSLRGRGLGRDVTRGALVIDIGAAVTHLCVVHGDLPSPADHVRLEKAGNFIDQRILSSSPIYYPGLCLTHRIAREIKEEQAFVGSSAEARRNISRHSDLMALTDVIREACESLLRHVLEAACGLLANLDPETARSVSEHVILTGGGSGIRSFPTALEARLRESGFGAAKVFVPEDPKRLVARGALRLAERLDDEEWETLGARGPAEDPVALEMRPAAPVGRPTPAASPSSGGPAASPFEDPAVAAATEVFDDPDEEDAAFGIDDLEGLDFFRGM